MTSSLITPGINLVPFSYVGNGQDGRRIEVGFQPDLVLIKGAGTTYAVFHTDTMNDDSTAYISNAAANLSDAIQTFYNKGLTIGTDASVNTSGTAYYGFAVSDHGGEYFQTFTYTGNGLDDRSLAIGLQSDWVLIKRDGANLANFRWGSDVGDVSYQPTSAGTLTDSIQSITTTGITVGARDEVNADTNTYHGFAFRELSGQINQFEYTGNSTDNTDITGLDFQAGVIFIKAESSNSLVLRTEHMQGDLSGILGNSALSANRIQSISGDGFQVGTDATVNNNLVIYNGIALRTHRVREVA